MKHLTSLLDLTPDELLQVLDRAEELKQELRRGHRPQLFPGRVLVQLFEKPSLRTRNSFEAAMIHLGGAGIFQTTAEAGLNGRESLSDVARVISSFADIITMRTFSQQLIEDFAKYSSCPVINGLSDDRHPCQALTDLLTIREHRGRLERYRNSASDTPTPVISPASTPTASVARTVPAIAVKSVREYSQVRRKSRKSTSDSTATTIVAESVACGRKCSAGVRNSVARAMAAAVNIPAAGVCAPAS